MESVQYREADYVVPDAKFREGERSIAALVPNLRDAQPHTDVEAALRQLRENLPKLSLFDKEFVANCRISEVAASKEHTVTTTMTTCAATEAVKVLPLSTVGKIQSTFRIPHGRSEKAKLAGRGEQITCTRCGGRGATDCGSCGGQGHHVCSKCNGTTILRERGGNTKQCHYCSERGIGGTLMAAAVGAADRPEGHQSCAGCLGRGFEKCEPCEQEGVLWHGSVFEVRTTANKETDHRRAQGAAKPKEKWGRTECAFAYEPEIEFHSSRPPIGDGTARPVGLRIDVQTYEYQVATLSHGDSTGLLLVNHDGQFDTSHIPKDAKKVRALTVAAIVAALILILLVIMTL